MQKEVYFYQQNVKVLTFNIKKEQGKILFNHYITQKENLQRIRKELPRGCFFMAINTAAEDTGMSVQQIRTLIRQFVDMGVIRKVQAFPAHLKKPTIWEYTSSAQLNTQINKEHNSQINIHQVSEFKDSDIDNNNHSINQTHDQEDISKKELYKKKILNIQECDDVLRLFSLYPNKIGKEAAMHSISLLLEEYSSEQIERCISRYVDYTSGKEKRYMKYASNFFESGYKDYLDENYEEDKVVVNTYIYDENTGEVIT